MADKMNTLMLALKRKLLCSCLFTALTPMIWAQNISAQFIHASADTSLEAVDIWVNNQKVADNLAFLFATAEITLPAGESVTISISDSASMDTANAILQLTDSFAVGEERQFILRGLSTAAPYSNFQALELLMLDAFQNGGNIPDNTAVRWVNANTDGGNMAVSEIKLGLGGLLTNFNYNALAQAAVYTTSNYRLRFQNNNGIQNEFEFDLSAKNLYNKAITCVFAGFNNPAINAGGSPLRLVGFDSTGQRYFFPTSVARVQFIHNSADPANEQIDVYRSDNRVLDNLIFRGASGYLNVPSGVNWNLDLVAGSDSTNNSPLYSMSRSFVAEQSYVAIVAGNSGAGFPQEEPLRLEIESSRRQALISNTTDVLFFNGSTDFEEANIFESSALSDNIFENISFSSFSAYSSLPYTSYRLDLMNATDNSLFATYDFILSLYALEGESITLMTSGFEDTLNNDGDAPLGLWFARSSSGLMTELPKAVGIHDAMKNERSVSVFPNPASDMLHIQTNDKVVHAKLITMRGEVAWQGKPSSEDFSVDVNQISKGLYLLILNHDDGGITSRKVEIMH